MKQKKLEFNILLTIILIVLQAASIINIGWFWIFAPIILLEIIPALINGTEKVIRRLKNDIDKM